MATANTSTKLSKSDVCVVNLRVVVFGDLSIKGFRETLVFSDLDMAIILKILICAERQTGKEISMKSIESNSQCQPSY